MFRFAFVLLAAAGAPGAFAAWHELGWCDTPLDGVETTIVGSQTLIARGDIEECEVSLWLTDLSLADSAPEADALEPLDIAFDGVIFGACGTTGATYLCEIDKELAGGSRRILTVSADRSNADLEAVALDVFKRSFFAPLPKNPSRAVALRDGSGVVALPVIFERFSRNVYALGRECVVRVVEHFPERATANLDLFQRVCEEHLRNLDYKATEGRIVSIGGSNVPARFFMRGTRSVAALYIAAGRWFDVVLVEAKTRETLDETLAMIVAGSLLRSVAPASRPDDVRSTASLIALMDTRGRLRLAFFDEQEQPIVWSGPLVAIEIVTKEGAGASQCKVRDSYTLSLRGEGYALPKDAARLTAHIAGGTDMTSVILKPPE